MLCSKCLVLLLLLIANVSVHFPVILKSIMLIINSRRSIQQVYDAHAAIGGPNAKIAPSGLIVKWKTAAAAKGAPGAKLRGRGLHSREKPRSNENISQAIARLKKNRNVQYVEPDYVLSALTTSVNDPSYGTQWNMPKVAAPLAWDSEQGSSGVKVCVIDTGADFNHPDLTGNVVPGYDTTGTSANGMDDNGHGSHCSGVM